MVTIGSLFSGIGGLELGLERALNAETIWQVEKDKHATTILERHWPDATRYSDITEVDFSELETPDILCGGFPCQDISAAGRKAGIEGAKSGLWKEFDRAIRTLRPRIIIVENVSALLVRGFDVVASDLASLGYDLRWECLRSADVGAPYRRERLFIVAHSKDHGLNRPRSSRARRPRSINSDTSTTNTDGARCEGHKPNERRLDKQSRWDFGDHTEAIERWAAIHGPPPDPKDHKNRLNPRFSEWMMGFDAGWVEGIPYTAQLRCTGNAVQPQVAELVGAGVSQW